MNFNFLLASVIFFSGFAVVASDELPELTRKPKPGVYALTNTSNYVLKDGKRVNLFDLPVDGVTNYITWRSVQPEEDAIRYPGLDRMLKEAVDAEKYLSYGILAGVHAPDWVYVKAGIPKFMSNPTKNQGSYLPWIELDGKRVLNEPFLKIWDETVQKFAERLYSDPHRDRINYVPITGFPFSNGLELFVPLAEPEFKALRYDQEAQRLYIDFCRRVVDIFIERLPDFPLGIAFADTYGVGSQGTIRSTYEDTAIIEYAIRRGRERGVTVVPMGLWMGWKGICDSSNHPLKLAFLSFQRQSGFGAWEGQMGTCRLNCLTLAEQLDLAERNQVTWVQFWHHDLICPKCITTLEERWAKRRK